MQERVQSLKAGEPAKDAGKALIGELRAGKLPQMVDWFDPALLAQIGMRSIVSGTMGEYADQRLMQAATDRVTEDDLRRRYDYSKTSSDQCSFWVDYVSDLGDGFEATYAIAYLMAAPSLQVERTPILEAGRILIMGGDQAYPQSSAQEYQARLLDPYNAAFTNSLVPPNSQSGDPLILTARAPEAGLPERNVFALPGNHDWYDGLGAFDSLFCSARDRISRGNGKLIGGWRCKQHRSYFAVRLPYDWWIWGADIQLEGVFDDPQRDYFDIMSEQVGPNGKVILCLAEPSWTHENYDNLFEIASLAQKYGGKVCAVLAGDLHHYSRYTADPVTKLANEGVLPRDVQFITCGGGGAFAHATHGLKQEIDLRWPDRPQSQADVPQNPAQAHRTSPLSEPDNSVRPGALKATSYKLNMVDEATYPSPVKSRLMCLKNLFLPFHNTGFALFVGFVYFMYAWVFSVTISAHDTNASLAEVSAAESRAIDKYGNALRMQLSPAGSDAALNNYDRSELAFETESQLGSLADFVALRAKMLSGEAAGYQGRTALTNLPAKIDAFIGSWNRLAIFDRAQDMNKRVPDFINGLEQDQLVIRDSTVAQLGYHLARAVKRYDVVEIRRASQAFQDELGKISKPIYEVVLKSEDIVEKSTDPAIISAAGSLAHAGAKAGDIISFISTKVNETSSEAHPFGFQNVAEEILFKIQDPQRVFLASQLNPAFFFMLLGLLFVLIYYADVAAKSIFGVALKIGLGTLHFIAHVTALLLVFYIVGPGAALTVTAIAVVAASLTGLAAFFLFGRMTGFIVGLAALLFLVFALQTATGAPIGEKISLLFAHVFSLQPDGWIMTHGGTHLKGLIGENGFKMDHPLVALLSVLTFMIATILLGGLLGAFIFGLYWTLMSVLFAKHKDDAFGALGIRHYKHFLRMKFEKDRLTIYPIAIDTVPGRTGWQSASDAAAAGQPIPPHKPLIMPRVALKPFMIEQEPIIIMAPGAAA